MPPSPTQLQTKVTLKFGGSKVDAIAPTYTFESSRSGGVAAGADGNLAQYSGTGEKHRITGVELWVRKRGLSFRPWEHTQVGEEFDCTFQQGDPAFGGKSITFTECLCRGEVQTVDNKEGMVKVSIPEIEAVGRSER